MKRNIEPIVEDFIKTIKYLEHIYNLDKKTVKKEILKYLFLNGEKSRYELVKELNKSPSVIFYAVKELLETKLIEISKTQQATKNKNIKVQYYKLTKTGLNIVLRLIIAEKLENKDIYIYPSREILHELEEAIKPILNYKEQLEDWQKQLSDTFLIRLIIDLFYHHCIAVPILVTKENKKEYFPDYGLATGITPYIEKYLGLIENTLEPKQPEPHLPIPNVLEYYDWLREKLTKKDITILLNYIANLAEKEHKRYLKLAEEFKTYVEKTKKLLSTLT